MYAFGTFASFMLLAGTGVSGSTQLAGSLAGGLALSVYWFVQEGWRDRQSRSNEDPYSADDPDTADPS